jgi:alpha-L-fucosidase
MDFTRRRFLVASAAFIPNVSSTLSAENSSKLVLPSSRQLSWHKLEIYAFLHLTVNTFTDKEWGYGDEDPHLFHPTAFDADAIVDALARGGMRGVILTAKHHDGFCLWPTRTTKHSVAASGWRDGKGDVVREISVAAAKRGLKFGVYLSPWDRNQATYGKPEYIAVYREQLRELLTGYGPIFEVWHDGANGGDGYYGGAREKRTIDKHSYYDWPRTWELVRSLQPDAVIFSDVGPDIRWVGNEKGYAGETCWATYDPVGENGGPPSPGDTKSREGMTGQRNGSHWLPAECDVSIRPGWFWHGKENARVKTSSELFDLYFRSVGRGASFLLNVPPDRRGLLHENDVASLAGFGRLLAQTFQTNLASRPKRKSSVEWTVELSGRGDVIRLREDIRQGQRIDSFTVEALQNNGWNKVAEGTSVGSCKLIRLDSKIDGKRLRLRVTRSSAPPALAEFSVYHAAT